MEQRSLFEKLNMKRSNRGAALITVIVVISIVSVLGLLSMSVAYTSFRMKVVDKDSTEVFYGAEKVLEEMSVGLQDFLSDSHTYAYTAVMANYGIYDDPAEMKLDYERLFMEHMKSSLDANADGFYDLTAGDSTANFATLAASLKTTFESAEEGLQVTISSSENRNYLDKTDKGIYLRNVFVSYEVNGFYNEITTDICLEAPNVTFALISEVPDLSNYALIASGGMEVIGNSEVRVDGKTGIGLLDTLLYPEDMNYSMRVETGATVSFANAEVVTEGDVQLYAGAHFLTDNKTTLWANGLQTNDYNNVISLLGKSYVRDDITINGEGNSLELGGHYFGYSNGTKIVEDAYGNQTEEKAADVSSAIIINGRNTEIMMSQLESLILAGTSYVGTKGETLAGAVDAFGQPIQTESNVFMGDSMAVKSNQLIYMVPTECEGITVNPMTYDQYKVLDQNEDWQDKALKTYISGLGRSISSYGDVKIVPVFTNKSGGGVYLYLQFETAAAASEYFMDCYGNTANGVKVKEFLENYVRIFKFEENPDVEVNIMSAGNYLVEADNGDAAYAGATGEIDQVSLGGAYQDMINKNQFDGLVREDAISGDFTAQSGEVQFLVVDNEGGTEYHVPDTFKGILIATGDVKVSSNANEIRGLIICKGRLNVVGSGMRLTADADIISRALNLEANGVSAKSFLKGFYNATTEVEGEDAITDIRQCVSFENWRSE